MNEGMADYCLDQAIQEQADLDIQINYWLRHDDSVLFDMTENAQSETIQGIRKYHRYSNRQRYTLAKWIAEHEDDDEDVDE